MKKTVRYATLAVMAAGICSCGLHKSELGETLEWMDNTYNPHLEENGSPGHGRHAWYTHYHGDKTEVMSSGLTETFTYSGCKMSLKTEDLPYAEGSQELSSKCTIRFNLKDIDPTSFKLTDRSHLGDFTCTDYSDEERQAVKGCDHTELSFSTRTGAGHITEDWITVYPKLSGKDHEHRHSDKNSSSYFEFDDPAYARRFAKAFTHAVELCGGRPSPSREEARN